MSARRSAADPAPCAAEKRRLGAWLDGELGPLEAAELRDHLMDCPACRAVVQRWTRVREELGHLDATGPSPEALQRMSLRFEEGLAREIRDLDRALRVWRVAAAFLLLLGLAALAADRTLLPGHPVAAREPGVLEQQLEELFSRMPDHAPLETGR